VGLTVGDIWLGDLARAWAATDARTAEERLAVARLLGLGDQPVERADPPPAPDLGTAPAGPGSSPRAPGSETPPDDHGKAPGAEAGSPADGEGVRKIGVEPVGVLRSTVSLPRPGLAREIRPYLPLIDPRLARSVLHHLITQRIDDGPVDVAALVHRAATRRMTGIPRRPSQTLRYGVQILSDEGDGMAPFARDQADVIRQARHLVGDGITDVTYFADAPLRGAGPGPVWTWRTYRTPPPGGCVLLLSHVGIGGPWPDPGRARRPEWEDFADLARRAGCRVVALLPYPLDRVPDWVLRLFPVVSWDRTLTVRRAGQARP
jgi:hypothetical protein